MVGFTAATARERGEESGARRAGSERAGQQEGGGGKKQGASDLQEGERLLPWPKNACPSDTSNYASSTTAEKDLGCSAPCSAPYLDRCDVRGPGVDGARAIGSRVEEGGGWGQLRRRAVLMGVCPTTRERGSEPLLKSCILCSHGTHKYVQKCARCCEHACEDGVLFRGKGKRAGREGGWALGGKLTERDLLTSASIASLAASGKWGKKRVRTMLHLHAGRCPCVLCSKIAVQTPRL